jgi:hypothetical protein
VSHKREEMSLTVSTAEGHPHKHEPRRLLLGAGQEGVEEADQGQELRKANKSREHLQLQRIGLEQYFRYTADRHNKYNKNVRIQTRKEMI